MILIVDDDLEFAVKLKNDLLRFYENFNVQIELMTYYDKNFILNNDVEILFLDIELGDGVNGIDLAIEYWNEGHDNIDTVFISSHDNYVHDSIIAFPRAYIRKSSEYYRTDLIKAVTVLNEWKRIREMRFILEGKIVKLTDIIYVESRSNYVYYNFIDGSHIKRRAKLSTIEAELKKFDFIRCHTSYIVNYKHVTNFNNQKHFFVLNDDIKIPISEKYENKVIDIIHEILRKKVKR